MINELSNLGIKIKRQSGEYKTTCPKCSHTRKNKSDKCLSVNVTRGIYNCHNCGWSGTVQKFSSKPEYIIPVRQNVQINARVLKWFEQRKITEPHPDRVHQAARSRNYRSLPARPVPCI